MRIIRTESFKQDFQALSGLIKRHTEQALRFFVANLRHPSVQAKKMEGQRDSEGRDIWEARITQACRFTFVIDQDIYILRRVGPHEDALRKP
jgi:mRNA-degrading endonuclease YafQ of YafQ-DinJ toxin-antitoxin module